MSSPPFFTLSLSLVLSFFPFLPSFFASCFLASLLLSLPFPALSLLLSPSSHSVLYFAFVTARPPSRPCLSPIRIMANPIFDDFLELDLLDPSDASNDMFSYYLSGASDENVGDLGAAAAALAANEDVSEDQSMDLVIKQEEDDDSGHHTRALLLLSPTSDNQESATLKTESVDMTSFRNDNAMLVSPDQLTISPQATTVSLSTISLKATSSVSTSAASSTGAKTQGIIFDPGIQGKGWLCRIHPRSVLLG